MRAVHTLQLSVLDFFKSNSRAKEVVSKVRNVAKKIQKQNIRELFKLNNNPLSRLDCETRWGSSFLMVESMLVVRDLLSKLLWRMSPSFCQPFIGLSRWSLLNVFKASLSYSKVSRIQVVQ